MSTNCIYTVAGTGSGGFSGDGGGAIFAELDQPTGVVALPTGLGYLISDGANNVVRQVDDFGTIRTIAGNQIPGNSGDGGPATNAQLSGPEGLSLTVAGGFLIADHTNNVVRRVAADGTITTVAGTGLEGFSGDGGPATQAELSALVSVAAQADGGFLISDTGNHVIRRVDPNGIITTVAGTPNAPGFDGDGGPADQAQLDHPDGVAVTADGGFLIADANNNVVRRIGPNGTIDVVAGIASAGFSGDGGPATSAMLDHPIAVAVTPDGGFLISEKGGHRVRRVTASGRITTIAGNGSAGSSGDGGPATLAELQTPIGVAATADGGVLIATIDDHRIRFVDAGL